MKTHTMAPVDVAALIQQDQDSLLVQSKPDFLREFEKQRGIELQRIREYLDEWSNEDSSDYEGADEDTPAQRVEESTEELMAKHAAKVLQGDEEQRQREVKFEEGLEELRRVKENNARQILLRDIRYWKPVKTSTMAPVDVAALTQQDQDALVSRRAGEILRELKEQSAAELPKVSPSEEWNEESTDYDSEAEDSDF